jgi:hypothetical protein
MTPMTSNAPSHRLPVKLHRRVCLILTEDSILAEELLARKKLVGEIIGRLSETTLLVKPGRIEVVLEELRKAGHTPQVIARPSSQS